VAIWVGVVAAALPGVWLLLGSPDFRPTGRLWWEIESMSIFGPATRPEWTLRSVFNWSTALLLAWAASSHVTLARAKSLLLLAAGGAVAASLVGYAAHVGLVSLGPWLATNPELLRLGVRRLMGTAGHSGWFAEWLVLAWPCCLLIFGGSRRRKGMAGLATAIVLAALLLTMARAGWLSLVVVGGLAFLHFRSRGQVRFGRFARLVLLASLVVALLALLLGGADLFLRARAIFRFQDRWNYYVSTYHLLRTFPFGTGLGLHCIVYESLFTPFHAFWQFDHVTAHSTWLHVLVEQGVFQVLLLAAGSVYVAVRAWKGAGRAEGEHRRILLVLSLAFSGILVDSLAQYLGYIRVVEVTTWIFGGMILGLTRAGGSAWKVREGAAARPPTFFSKLPPIPEALRRRWGVVLVALAVVFGVVTAWSHLLWVTRSPPPRFAEYDPEVEAIHLWTERTWRFPVDPRWCGVEFVVSVKGVPQDLVIDPPGGKHWSIHAEPGESLYIRQSWKPRRKGGAFRSLHWLTLDCSNTWIPARVDPISPDLRSLGVYIGNLRPLYCDDDPLRPPTQWWWQRDGNGVSRIDGVPGGR